MPHKVRVHANAGSRINRAEAQDVAAIRIWRAGAAWADVGGVAHQGQARQAGIDTAEKEGHEMKMQISRGATLEIGDQVSFDGRVSLFVDSDPRAYNSGEHVSIRRIEAEAIIEHLNKVFDL
jgi:hypothetical protein